MVGYIATGILCIRIGTITSVGKLVAVST